MFIANNVMLQFFLFWLFGMAMTSFACCTSVFLSTSQSAGNAGLAMILVRSCCVLCVSCKLNFSQQPWECESTRYHTQQLQKIVGLTCRLFWCCMQSLPTGGLDLPGAGLHWDALFTHNLLHTEWDGEGVLLGICIVSLEPPHQGCAGHVCSCSKSQSAR